MKAKIGLCCIVKNIKCGGRSLFSARSHIIYHRPALKFYIKRMRKLYPGLKFRPGYKARWQRQFVITMGLAQACSLRSIDNHSPYIKVAGGSAYSYRAQLLITWRYQTSNESFLMHGHILFIAWGKFEYRPSNLSVVIPTLESLCSFATSHMRWNSEKTNRLSERHSLCAVVNRIGRPSCK